MTEYEIEAVITSCNQGEMIREAVNSVCVQTMHRSAFCSNLHMETAVWQRQSASPLHAIMRKGKDKGYEEDLCI